jgi:hypothetical protein
MRINPLPAIFAKLPAGHVESRRLAPTCLRQEASIPKAAASRSMEMKFILMMNTPAGGEYQIMSWPQPDIEAHIAFMMALNRKLRAAGELASCEGLTPPSQARLVRAGKDGKPVTDGVFPETKEYLAGWWIVDVPNRERAWEIAAEASLAPGIGGVPLYLPIEVREVMALPT